MDARIGERVVVISLASRQRIGEGVVVGTTSVGFMDESHELPIIECNGETYTGGLGCLWSRLGVGPW